MFSIFATIDQIVLVLCAFIMPSKTSSWIWTHDASNKPINQRFHHDKDGNEVWKCRHCHESKYSLSVTYKRNGGTGTAAKYLKNKHRIAQASFEDSDIEHDTNSIQQTSTDLDSRSGSIAMAFRQIGTQRSNKRRRITQLEDVSASHLSECLQNYIIDCTLSFRHVERAAFRAFIACINPIAEELLPKSHTTISTGILTRYVLEKQRIRALLSTALTRIHMSCDAWTCENAGKAYLGITVRFASAQGRHQFVLAIKRLHGSHTGENMAEVMCSVAQDFDITSSIGFCNSDNASPNDTMTNWMESELEKQGIRWSAKLNRLRCVGHISNLAVQALLHGKHPDSDDNSDLEMPSFQQMNDWYKSGTLSKVHRLIVYIYASTQRREIFLRISDRLNLIRDNDTRWTSWYDTITRILRLKSSVILWQSEHQADRSIKMSDRPAYLELNDWEQLQVYHDFLEPYRDVTLATQGYSDGLDKILLGMDILLIHLEEGRTTYANNDFFTTAIETSWNVLNKYYNLTDESPAYVAAVVMDPRRKWQYFEKNWTTDSLKQHISIAQAQVRNHALLL